MKAYPAYKESGLAWMPEIPEHWGIRRAKYLFSLLERPVEEHSEIITCFRDGVVTLRKNRRLTGFTESISEIGYQGIKKGDLVIHQMDAFAGSVGVSDSDGKSTPVYSVCSPKVDLSPHFYAYVIRVMARTNYILSLAKGIRQRSSDFRFPTFARCILPFPPKEEQQAIVAYLDKKCAEIEELISRKRAIIERLKELKQSIIAETVTKGLNPEAPMKESGLAWMPEIPEHWKMIQYRAYFTERKETNFNLQEKNLLSLSYGRIIKKDINKSEGLTPASYATYNIIEEGDIVLRLTDLQNDHKSLRTALCTQRGIITSAYVTLRPLHCNVNSSYFQYQLHVFDVRKSIYGVGGGVRQTLNYDAIVRLKACVPPAEEQQAIVAYLDKKCAAIDELVSRHEQTIEKLKELKTATIADVVTGKVDVRESI